MHPRAESVATDSPEAVGSREPTVGQGTRRSGDGLRVLVTIQHPAHVHFFRPIVRELEERGSTVRVCAREKDVAIPLLEANDIEHEVLAESRTTTVGRAAEQLRYEGGLLWVARRFRPDVVTAIGGVAAAHVARVTGAKSVVLTDSEPATLTNRLAFPFADVVCTPQWYDDSIDGTHVRYDGFHELAYLHPDRFSPDPSRLEASGVDPDRPYAVVRLVSWDAQHDVGQSGFSNDGVHELLDALTAHGDVYVSAEGAIPGHERAEPIPVPPAEIHHLLAFGNCYVGDSQTMATEAGLLGTPAVRYNSFVSDADMANFRELAAAGLVYSTDDERKAIETAIEYATDTEASERWEQRLGSYREDKIDVTAFVTDLLAEVAR